MSALTTIRNLGPATAQAFLRVGITSAEELREIGAEAGYGALLAGGERPHFIGFYALVMGLQGRPWNDCRGAEKDALRLRFDALVAEHGGRGPRAAGPDAPPGHIEVELDRIGLPRRG